MRRAALALAALIALIATTPASNQAIDYTTLIGNQSGNFTWATTAPTGSNQLVTAARYRALVAQTACPYSSATGSQIVNWNFVIACASSHTPSLQSEGVSGGYSTVYYTATYHSVGNFYSCSGPNGSDAYSGTPITLPAGTVAPTTSGTELSINLTSVTVASRVTAYVSLVNPSGVTKLGPTVISGSYSNTYSAAGAPAGAWSWSITQSGATDGSCDSTSGASGGGTQMSFSGTASWYQ